MTARGLIANKMKILPTLRPYLSTMYVEIRQVGTPTMNDTVPSRSTSSAEIFFNYTWNKTIDVLICMTVTL